MNIEDAITLLANISRYLKIVAKDMEGETLVERESVERFLEMFLNIAQNLDKVQTAILKEQNAGGDPETPVLQ